MGRIISSYIFPHPPVLVPEVGKGDENNAAATLKALRRASLEIRGEAPTTVIVTTPHMEALLGPVQVTVSPEISGSFGRFGAPGVKLEFGNNTGLAGEIIALAESEGFNCALYGAEAGGRIKPRAELDHGAAVPLYFVSRELKGFKLVHISVASLELFELYRFGTCISKAVERSDERVVFIASGDLSHRLSDASPYGFDKSGPEFDRRLIESLRGPTPEKLLETGEDFCESAGQCGLPSIVIMLGALDRRELKADIYSYEGPFGIGYLVARLEPGEDGSSESLPEKLAEAEAGKLADIREGEDPYVALARETLEAYVRNNRRIAMPADLPPEMLENRAGVFVSIKKHGRLRGCIGTISPVRRNIAAEIMENAVSSGTQDPRFDPVKEEELGSLVYSVDVLMEPEPIDSIKQLDVVKYGVIVRAGRRSGLLLPNLEGVDTPEDQVGIALRKAGIRPEERYTMERFEVVRHL
jgi:AmmeMemoRadiSam system protein A